jgi:hypothetical protein
MPLRTPLNLQFNMTRNGNIQPPLSGICTAAKAAFSFADLPLVGCNANLNIIEFAIQKTHSFFGFT